MNTVIRLKLAAHRLIGDTPLYGLYNRLKYRVMRKVHPNAGYTSEYYETIEQINETIHPLVARTLYDVFKPERLVDVGCGGGGISFAFKQAGVREIHCFDYSEDAVQRARGRGLPDVRQLDLTAASEVPAQGDLCICMEVAEHLPPEHARHLCHVLSAVAPTLVFTAAPPGQGGHLHVNEQPQSYWIELMAAEGMRYDAEAVARVREGYAGKASRDYDDNLMVFRRQS